MKKILIITMLLFVTCTVFSQTRIKMKKEGGVYTVPCKVNDLNLRFIFDTGASNVCISLAEAIFMLKNGYLSEDDIVGKGKSQVADGSLVENTHIILREIEISGMKLYNIDAVIMNNLDAPLLFGQTAIQKLGTVQLQGDELVIMSGKANIPYIKRSSGADWYEVHNDDEKKIEIDLNSIKREGEYVTCYEKWTFIDERIRKENVNSTTDIFCKNKLYDECLKIQQKWKDYMYYLMKSIYNYKENMRYIQSSTFYDKKGAVIHSSNYQEDIEWDDILPETIASGILDDICSQYKITYNGQTYWMYIEDAVPFLDQYPQAKLVE